MKRRAAVKSLRLGAIPLESPQAHHIRDVLRLGAGDELELFDADGATAQGVITQCDRQAVLVEVRRIDPSTARPMRLTIAAAVPRGQRADWMIEKLSELGVDQFIPLRCHRSVVIPGGKNKMERWSRLAEEAARQSRRRGVMRIMPTVTPAQLLESPPSPDIWHLSTAADAEPMSERPMPRPLTLMIGPEGGWSDDEAALFIRRRLPALALTSTILRVETAAVAAAAVALCRPAD